MRFALRLDDGSLVSGQSNGSLSSLTARKLSPQEAFSAGKLTAQHIHKAELLLYKLECLLQGDRWIDGDQPAPLAADSKRKSDVFVQDAQPGIKRMRSTHTGMGNGYAGAVPSVSEVSRDSQPPVQRDFELRCLHMVKQVVQGLGATAVWFTAPVDRKLVPDYYNIIKNPMDLGTIQKKLRGHEYPNPQEFYQDMDLVWRNCSLYNKKGDPVQKAGEKGEEIFTREWTRAGFPTPSGARARRVTAGVAAEKYEPQLHAPPEKKRTYSQPARTTSRQPGRSRQGGGGGGKHHDAVEQRVRQWTPAHVTVVTEVLSDDMSEDFTAQVLGIVQAYSDPNGDGEVELDLDALPQEALWKLYDLIISKGLRPPVAAAAPPVNHMVSGDDLNSYEDSQ